MAAEDFRAKIRALDERRRAIEAELTECSLRLAETGVGMDGKLVDDEVRPSDAGRRFF